MLFKKSQKKAFTLIELLVVIAILAVLTGIVIIAINPQRQFAKSRDSQRMSDVGNLVTSIQEYYLENSKYPDSADVTRVSNILPPGGDYYTAFSSWIFEDLSDFVSKMVVDPTNSGDYVYRYRHDSVGFEVDVMFEHFTEKHTQDGGNNDTRYELGSDLTLLD